MNDLKDAFFVVLGVATVLFVVWGIIVVCDEQEPWWKDRDDEL